MSRATSPSRASSFVHTFWPPRSTRRTSAVTTKTTRGTTRVEAGARVLTTAADEPLPQSMAFPYTTGMPVPSRAGDLLAGAFASQVLGHLVTKQARLHPPDDEDIDQRHEGAVHDAVLRPSEAARPMRDRHLHDAIAAQAQQGRDESMEPPVERQPAEAFPAKGAKGTAAVLDDLVAHPVPHAVAHARRHAPDQRVAVAAVHAPAAGGVPPIELGEQARDVGR